MESQRKLTPTTTPHRSWLARAAVALTVLGAASFAIAQRGGGPPDGVGNGRPGGGEEEVAGNNLSFPVIWSDGIQLPLRGTYGDPIFLGAYTDLEGVRYYHQQDELNEWQAETFNARDEQVGPVDVSYIDWGDNLEARAWNVNSIVRVETVLYQDLLAEASEQLPEAMSAFKMAYLSGQGPSELWGTDGTEPLSLEATVYSGFARLTIQKIETPGDTSLIWNATAKKWEGEGAGLVFFNAAVYEAGTGPEVYSAEINVSGKVIYGFNWNVRRLSNGAGVYRLTFSIDQLPGVNTVFDTSEVIPFGEGEVEGASNPSGGVTVVDTENDLTYVDVLILPKTGGGKNSGR